MRLWTLRVLALALAAAACGSDGTRPRTTGEPPSTRKTEELPLAQTTSEPPSPPAPPTRGALDVRVDRAGLDGKVVIAVSVFRHEADGALESEKSGHSKRDSPQAIEAISFPDLAPGGYVVRATAVGRRTVAADVDVRAGAATPVALDLSDRGGELVAVLAPNSTLPEALEVTAHRLGAGVRGDVQRASTKPGDRQVRLAGLGPGRYLLEFENSWSSVEGERAAIVVEMTDEPLCRIELPATPPVPAWESRVSVRALRGSSSVWRLTIAWIPGRVTALEPGVWIRSDKSPARIRTNPGTYTAAVLDGFRSKEIGLASGIRLQTFDLAAGQTWSVDVPLD